jgi:hypothetical protein
MVECEPKSWQDKPDTIEGCRNRTAKGFFCVRCNLCGRWDEDALAKRAKQSKLDLEAE